MIKCNAMQRENLKIERMRCFLKTLYATYLQNKCFSMWLCFYRYFSFQLKIVKLEVGGMAASILAYGDDHMIG